MVTEVQAGPRRLRVDLIRHGSTAARVVDRALGSAEEEDPWFETRFHGGFAAAYRSLLAHRVDVIFGRPGWARVGASQGYACRLVRLEPIGVLVDEDHAWAGRSAIEPTAFKGLTIDTSAGNVDAGEWVDLTTELVEQFGGTPSPDHHPGMSAVGPPGPGHGPAHPPDRCATTPFAAARRSSSSSLGSSPASAATMTLPHVSYGMRSSSQNAMRRSRACVQSQRLEQPGLVVDARVDDAAVPSRSGGATARAPSRARQRPRPDIAEALRRRSRCQGSRRRPRRRRTVPPSHLAAPASAGRA